MGVALNLEEDNVGCILFGESYEIKEGDTVKGSLDGVAYLEAGSKKRDRFGCVVTFPKEVIGKPVVLEIASPADGANVSDIGAILLSVNRTCFAAVVAPELEQTYYQS